MQRHKEAQTLLRTTQRRTVRRPLMQQAETVKRRRRAQAGMSLAALYPIRVKQDVTYRESTLRHGNINFGRRNVLAELLLWSSLSTPEHVVMFGHRDVPNRRTFQVTETGEKYMYKGVTKRHRVYKFTEAPLFAELRDIVAAHTGVRYNFVLVNVYTGQGKISWHADDEPQIDQRYPIVSLSFSTAPRRFQVRDPSAHEFSWTFLLDNNDILVMGGRTQAQLKHQVPQQKMPEDYYRVNLTFRMLK